MEGRGPSRPSGATPMLAEMSVILIDGYLAAILKSVVYKTTCIDLVKMFAVLHCKSTRSWKQGYYTGKGI